MFAKKPCFRVLLTPLRRTTLRATIIFAANGTPPAKVTWVQLYCGNQAIGNPTKIVADNTPRNVSFLAHLVKAELHISLQHCDAACLTVYPPGTVVHVPLDPVGSLDPDSPIPDKTTGENPLIVVAPLPLQRRIRNDTWDLTKDIEPTQTRMYHEPPPEIEPNRFFSNIAVYRIADVPLLALDTQQTIEQVSLPLHDLNEDFSSGRIDEIEKDPMGQNDALGNTDVVVSACCDASSYQEQTAGRSDVLLPHMHNWTSAYDHNTWDSRWSAIVSLLLARPQVRKQTELENDYTVSDAIDAGTPVFLSSKELRVPPGLLAKFNGSHRLFNPLLVKRLTIGDDWTWQHFEQAHVLYLAATMAAIIREQNRFVFLNLGTFLRNAQPEDSPLLSCPLRLPPTFESFSYMEQTHKCIPRCNATPGTNNKQEHTVSTEDFSQMFMAANGTPFIDAFVNVVLEMYATDAPYTKGFVPYTLFIQYKHSTGLSSPAAISVSAMNNEVIMFENRLAQCGWSKHQEWIFLWITNREVVVDTVPHEKLLWVGRADLESHAPLLGFRGLVPLETHRQEENVRVEKG